MSRNTTTAHNNNNQAGVRRNSGSRSPPPEAIAKFYKPAAAAVATSTPTTIPLIDPTTKGGLIQVPVSKTLDTKGRAEYLKGILAKEVSLCCLFQKGRCHAADKCHQIHVDLAFMRAVRQQHANTVSCCRAHQDTASLSGTAISFFALHLEDAETIDLVSDRGVVNTIAANQIAITTALTQYAEEGGDLKRIPVRQVCRLHLKGFCKYAKDCKRIHLCSQLGEAIIDGPVAQPAAASQRTPTTPPPAVRKPAPATEPKAVQLRTASQTTTPKPAARDGLWNRADSFAGTATPPPTRQPSLAAAGGELEGGNTSSIGDLEKSTSTLAAYFTTDRFTTPPPELSTSFDDTQSPSDDDVLERALCAPLDVNTMSKIDFGANVSFMEGTIKMQDLFFDPALLSECDPALAAPVSCGPKAADELFDCGVSSTTSRASTARGSWNIDSTMSNWASPQW